MSRYMTIAGDTFERVARKVYGDDLRASQVAAANPDAAEPLTPGTELTIPALPVAGMYGG
jgi:nucleoid-associated protein YgaU